MESDLADNCVFVSPLKRRSLPSSFPTTTELVNTADGKIVKVVRKLSGYLRNNQFFKTKNCDFHHKKANNVRRLVRFRMDTLCTSWRYNKNYNMLKTKRIHSINPNFLYESLFKRDIKRLVLLIVEHVIKLINESYSQTSL